MRIKKIRNSIAIELYATLKNILSKIEFSDEHHYEVIESFAKNISSKHKNVLKDDNLRIGIAQKLINLYWKFSWLLKQDVKMPLHCPFDSVVIKGLDKSVWGISWTKLEEISEYKMLVKAAREKADISGKCIAEWELDFYHKKVNYNLGN